MLLTEFDEEKDWAIIAKGHEEIGYKEGKKEGIKGSIEILKELGLSVEQIYSKIQQKFNISCEEANNYISECMIN